MGIYKIGYVKTLKERLEDILSEDYQISVSFIGNDDQSDSFYKIYVKDNDTVNDHVHFMIRNDKLSFFVDFDNDPNIENYIKDKEDEILETIKNN